jgi:hypothetical protein
VKGRTQFRYFEYRLDLLPDMPTRGAHNLSIPLWLEIMPTHHLSSRGIDSFASAKLDGLQSIHMCDMVRVKMRPAGQNLAPKVSFLRPILMAAKAIESGKGRERSHRNRTPTQSVYGASTAGDFREGRL